MKTGTLRCWLFGHKFVMWSGRSEDGEYVEGTSWLRHIDFCVRCGKDKEC